MALTYLLHYACHEDIVLILFDLWRKILYIFFSRYRSTWRKLVTLIWNSRSADKKRNRRISRTARANDYKYVYTSVSNSDWLLDKYHSHALRDDCTRRFRKGRCTRIFSRTKVEVLPSRGSIRDLRDTHTVTLFADKGRGTFIADINSYTSAVYHGFYLFKINASVYDRLRNIVLNYSSFSLNKNIIFITVIVLELKFNFL